MTDQPDRAADPEALAAQGWGTSEKGALLAALAAERAARETAERALDKARTDLANGEGGWAERVQLEARYCATERAAREAAEESGREYIRRTDPIIACGVDEKACGSCRSCWMARAEAAEKALRERAECLHREGVKARSHDHHGFAGFETCNSLFCVQARAALAGKEPK